MTAEALHTRVAEQAARTPDTVAVEMGRDHLTYGVVEAQSNRLARAISAAGCGKGDRVALFVPKCPEAVVAMLAVMKAGGVYVPVDLDSPASRVAHVINKAEPALLIAHGKAHRLLADLSTIVDLPRAIALEAPGLDRAGLELAGDYGQLSGHSADTLPPLSAGEDLAHLLFTSGSTGLPKGVQITHANACSYLDWSTAYFGMRVGDRVSGHPPLHFDLSTFDIYAALSTGATLCMVPPAANLLAPKLADFIRDAALNQWFSVPSILTYMANFDVVAEGDFPALKRLMWCGEAMPPATLIYWMERLPHVEFTNLYGPTEATIASSFHTVRGIPASVMDATPIGKPCGGETLHVLDEHLRPVPDGEIGEIYIGGVGLSPGYWRDAEKTEAAFRIVTETDGRKTRIYRTGDLGRRSEDGNFHYHGRTDSQIKNRGYRIELGEIEVAVNSLEYLQESAIVGVDVGGFEGTAICCAYVAEPGKDAVPQQIRKDLGSIIPRYMLPTQWIPLESLPKNANGKTDRPALRDLFRGQMVGTS